MREHGSGKERAFGQRTEHTRSSENPDGYGNELRSHEVTIQLTNILQKPGRKEELEKEHRHQPQSPFTI